jgi:hypothetical protein
MVPTLRKLFARGPKPRGLILVFSLTENKLMSRKRQITMSRGINTTNPSTPTTCEVTHPAPNLLQHLFGD